MKASDKESLMYEVANMYYNKNMTQNEIARQMFISRTSISRLLQQARDSSLVEIRINYRSERCSYLEELFRKHLGLKEAYIFDHRNADNNQMLNSICSSAAEYLRENISGCGVFGVGRGTIMNRVLDNVKSHGVEYPKLKLVQMHGCESTSDTAQSSENMMRRMLDLFKGTAYYLNVPMYLNSEALKTELENEPSILRTLELISTVDMVFTGIGALSANWQQTSFITNYLDEKTISELISVNCVGHIFGQFFDINGRHIDHPVNRCCMGVRFEDIPNIPRVVSVVCGEDRAMAALGAIRGRLTNVTFMDRSCAEKVLEYNQKY